VKHLHLALAVLLCGVSHASAGTILLPPSDEIAQIDYFEPIGQSFTAEDPFVLAGLYFYVINGFPDQGFDPNESIEYGLYAGVGSGGTLLATTAFTLPVGFSDFYLVNFSTVPLVVGAEYTLTASVLGTSAYWGVESTDAEYARGVSVYNGVPYIEFPATLPFPELAIEVEPIPEPTTLTLLGLGVVGMGLRRRRH
jgi:hypothetical protein